MRVNTYPPDLLHRSLSVCKCLSYTRVWVRLEVVAVREPLLATHRVSVARNVAVRYVVLSPFGRVTVATAVCAPRRPPASMSAVTVTGRSASRRRLAECSTRRDPRSPSY